MAHAEHAQTEPMTHEHEEMGSLQTRLMLTLVGGLLIANAFLSDWFFFPAEPAVGSMSALLGALVLGVPIIVGGFREMSRGRMHMSTLVAIAVLSAFVLGGQAKAEGALEVGGYRVAGIVAFFMLLASLIEAQTARGARESVERLMEFQPNQAELIDGTVVDVAALKPGDHVRLRPGDRVPADGRLLSGKTTVNEATITGESLPADKGEDRKSTR